jgi:type I restriction enzyme S subunit
VSDPLAQPADWSRRTVLAGTSKIMDYRGRTPRKLGLSWGGGTIRALSAGNVRMGHIDFAEECHLGSENLYRRWMTHGDMAPGDVLLTTEAPLGNVAAVPDTQKYILSQRTVLLRPDPEEFDKTYFLKCLQAPAFQRMLIENATGSTALGIKRTRLEQLALPRPSLSEQRRIGAVLGSYDQLLDRLKHLIAKKQCIKQGLVQQLLTGKARLPGYAGAVTEYRLEDVSLKIQDGTHFSPVLGGTRIATSPQETSVLANSNSPTSRGSRRWSIARSIVAAMSNMATCC